MNLFKLKKVRYPFSERELRIFRFLCQCYLKYNPKTASFLYMITGKTPEETDYELDLSNIKAYWFPLDDSGTLGAWEPLDKDVIHYAVPNPAVTDNYIYQEGDEEKGWIRNTLCDPLSQTIFNMLQNFGVIMHEFYHMFQFKTCPVGYVAMRFVSLFTTLPYYLFQNADWMPAYRKFFEWDIEGQAEKYGDKAPEIGGFIRDMTTVFTAYECQASQRRSAKRDPQNYDEEALNDIEHYPERQFKQEKIPSSIVKMGTELWELYKKESTFEWK